VYNIGVDAGKHKLLHLSTFSGTIIKLKVLGHNNDRGSMMSPNAVPGLIARTFNQLASHVPGIMVATMGAGAMGGALADGAEAKSFSSLYTDQSPAMVLEDIQNDLTPNQGLIISAAELTPSTLTARGDCTQGSKYRAWVDSPNNLSKTECNSNTLNIPQNFDTVRYEKTLSKIGATLINSIPGQSIDIKQKAQKIKANRTSLFESFACPSPNSSKPYPQIKTVKISQNNKAAIVFCPSDKAIDISGVNTDNPKYRAAFNEITKDPVRNQLWGGDHYKNNLFTECPQIPFTYEPNLSFKYTPGKGISTTFRGLSTMEYCDKVGQYTSEVSAQTVTSAGKSRQIGKSVMHIDGLHEILVFGSSTFFPSKYQEVRASLPDTQSICKGSLKYAQVRVRLTERFKGMKSQQFVHAPNGATTGMPSVTKTIRTEARAIC